MSAQPPPAWLALARWLVAPRQREEAEGDLIELWLQVTECGARGPALRFWREALSLAIASRRRTHPPATRPMPNVSIEMVAKLKPGARRRNRSAYRAS